MHDRSKPSDLHCVASPGGYARRYLVRGSPESSPVPAPVFSVSANEAPIVPTLADPRAPQPCFHWTDIPLASCPAPVESASTLPIPSDDDLSRLPHGPGQRAGKTYRQFFEHREAQWRQWEQAETAKTRVKVILTRGDGHSSLVAPENERNHHPPFVSRHVVGNRILQH